MILNGDAAVGNTSRSSSSPVKSWRSEFKARKLRTTAHSTRRKRLSTSIAKKTIVWSGRYRNGGVLLWEACTGWDGRSPQYKLSAVVRSGRYKNNGILCAARPGRDDRRPEEKVQIKGAARGRRLVWQVEKRRSTVRSTPWTGRSLSAAEIAKPKAVASSRRSEGLVQKRRSTVRSTPPTGWSTLAAESAKPKAAASSRRSEWLVQKRRNTVGGTPRTKWSLSSADIRVSRV